MTVDNHLATAPAVPVQTEQPVAQVDPSVMDSPHDPKPEMVEGAEPRLPG
jgi:hypothetical protein